MDYPALLRRVLLGADLSESESASVIGTIMDAEISHVQAAGMLCALAAKGESVAEVTGAARAMRERSLHVEHGLPLVVDIVGTGGDGARTINISTMAALVVAAAGVPVAKHGNRGSSNVRPPGSADVLEASGMKIDAGPDVAARMLREAGFTFMFAQRYHPAMRNVAPVRSELGVRTIFNILGPLTNPALATHQVVGVARESQLELVGEVLRALGVRAGAVVHSASGIDEVSGEGLTTVYTFGDGESRRWQLDPATYGIAAPLESIEGGTLAAATEAFARILGGERSPRSDVVALNAALVFTVTRHAAEIGEGLELARSILHAGKAAELFERVRVYGHE